MVLQKYSIDSFVAGSSAVAFFLVVSSVIKEPMQYSPIFLYGGAAAEKAYLLRSIVGKFKQAQRKPALYATAEQFLTDLMFSMRTRQKELFNQKYRNNNLLIIDGIQMFSGKERTQRELLITLKEFQVHERQIILTANSHPYYIKKFDNDLRDFCQGGLMFEIK